MQRQGKIINIQPSGGYDGRNGHIFTYAMTIQCQDGQFTGEIGSKSQPYPKAVGQDVTVEETPSDYGPKFKAVNAQYPNQGGGQQQGSDTPPSQVPQDKPDWDKIAKGKVRHGIVCAAIQSGQMRCKSASDIKHYVDLVMDKPANTGFFNAEEQAAHDVADGLGDDAGAGGDDIPF